MMERYKTYEDYANLYTTFLEKTDWFSLHPTPVMFYELNLIKLTRLLQMYDDVNVEKSDINRYEDTTTELEKMFDCANCNAIAKCSNFCENCPKGSYVTYYHNDDNWLIHTNIVSVYKFDKVSVKNVDRDSMTDDEYWEFIKNKNKERQFKVVYRFKAFGEEYALLKENAHTQLIAKVKRDGCYLESINKAVLKQVYERLVEMKRGG